MSSSIAGLHAIASKPGQSLAPMIGWFVLRSAGYSASTMTIPSLLPTEDGVAGADGPILSEEGKQAAAVGGHAAIPIQGENPGLGKGDVFGALLQLLIFLPGTVGLIQLGLWQSYRLHGVVLGMNRTFPLPLVYHASW